MAIRTKMKKSGSKRVYDQDGEGVRGQLNRVAREVFSGDHPEITRGPNGLRAPVIQSRAALAQPNWQRSRRRSLASVHRTPKSGG